MRRIFIVIIVFILLMTGCAKQTYTRNGICQLNQVDKNEYMSGGEAVVHSDPYNSDVSNVPGVMNIDTRLSYSYDSENNSSLIFTDDFGNKITPYKGGIAIRDFTSENIVTLGSFIPSEDDGEAYVLQTSYMYIDNQGNAIAPTNDGRMLIIRMSDENGRVLNKFEKLADIPISELAGEAFAPLPTDKNLLSLVADYKGNVWFASGGMCVYPEVYPGGYAGYIEHEAVDWLISGKQQNISEKIHFIRFEGREGMTGEAAENGISSCKEGVVVLTNMSCYMLRPGKDGSVEQVWKQDYESNGANIAPEGALYSGGGLAWGSGTTPTLSKTLVFFTNNADPISLLALDIKSGEIVARQLAFETLDKSVMQSVDNSIAVYSPDENTNMVMIGNTFGLWSKGIHTDPINGDGMNSGSLISMDLIKNGNKAIQPGFVRIDVTRNGDSYESRTVWSRENMLNSCVARLSAPGGRLYLYNQDINTGVWQFEVLDVGTGKTLYTIPVGDKLGCNNCGAIILIDPDGHMVSVPTMDKHLWSAYDDYIEVENAEAIITGKTCSIPDIGKNTEGYLYRIKLSCDKSEAAIAVKMTAMTANASKLELYMKNRLGKYEKFSRDRWSITEGDTIVNGELSYEKCYTVHLKIADNSEVDLDESEGNYSIAIQLVC